MWGAGPFPGPSLLLCAAHPRPGPTLFSPQFLSAWPLSALLSFWAWVAGRECVADLHSAGPGRHCVDPSKEHIAFDPEPQGESREGDRDCGRSVRVALSTF